MPGRSRRAAGEAREAALNARDRAVLTQFPRAHLGVPPDDEACLSSANDRGRFYNPATLALGDRFRLHAIGFGLSFRPSVVIRQHILTAVDLPDLVDRGMLPDEVGRLLHAAILARKSVVISGDHRTDTEQLLCRGAKPWGREMSDACPTRGFSRILMRKFSHADPFSGSESSYGRSVGGTQALAAGRTGGAKPPRVEASKERRG